MSNFEANKEEMKRLDANLDSHVRNLISLKVDAENLIANVRKQSGADCASENKTCVTGSHQEEKQCCVGQIEWPVERIRDTFIQFFVEKHQHVFWASSPVVPLDDPTLFFANAGMNQFKPLFLGTADPSMPMSRLTRAVNTQKCIRAGGKHNDLDDVGKDVYHHTFFEMLGNWSFGSYFKEEAIAWAWECLVDVFHLNPERLYATYFGGAQNLNLPADDDARQIWLRYLPESRVLPYGAKENFWEMGETGPCGPCTEIHYDRIGNRDASSLVNADDASVIEIWNNVFIQFNRQEDRSLRELPAKHVDTGMGLERLASILQGKMSNYDTDIFMPIFDVIHSLSRVSRYSGLVGPTDLDKKDMAYRVVADHIRTLTFAITDGAVPSNDGRGYILRRILRRAVRYGQQILGTQPGFFHQLVDVVVSKFSVAFPELLVKQRFVRDVITQEEISFNRTLDKGIKHFNKIVKEVRDVNAACAAFPGKAAHFLYTTMGFPVDLTDIMAEEAGLRVDKAAFAAGMAEEKRISEMAELARKGVGGKDLTMEAEQTNWLITHNVPVTNGSSKYDWAESVPSQVVAVYCGKDVGFVSTATDGDGLVGVVLSVSPFYYESGGQIYDTGKISSSSSSDHHHEMIVSNVQSYAGYVVHVGCLETGSRISVGDPVDAIIDLARRSNVAPNHTMTHVLNYALRCVLNCKSGASSETGQTCDQKGSFVDESKLRFDFSWNSGLTKPQLKQVEDIVNGSIMQRQTVFTETIPIEQASEITSLRRVFGEKYPELVRVVSIGQPIQPMLLDPTNEAWFNYSIEFCGGTHLSNTSDADLFQLMEEGSIAKGIRRIVAVTRDCAKQAKLVSEGFNVDLERIEAMQTSGEMEECVKRAKIRLDSLEISVVDKHAYNDRLDALGEGLKKFRKAEGARKLATAASAFEGLLAGEGRGNVLVARIDFGGDMKLGKKLVVDAANSRAAEAFFLASADEASNRVSFFVAVGEGCRAAGKSASQWLAAAMEGEGGKAGGTAEFASGSLEGIEKLGRVMERAGHS